ncbi:RNA polymerase sigma factor [Rasiella rasia]|uniref:RNA polymerase sigma factor n=1 Tax=Rasiella rasia TaxID=2744027 RepID=A0A6G6GJ54_9FLAO|nr:RNA polymerase sigma factor [Rasiella rasia]QIE58530.1 RNA polymerase sigma factor [Rasiella rasia]
MALTHQDISTVLVLCKKGNQLAQLEVYNRYNKAMYNVAYRIVKDTALAEDCMQEAFISAFTKLDSFKGDAAFGAWLKRIVVNNSLVQYKKSKRYVPISENLENGEEMEYHDGLASEDYSSLKVQHIRSGMRELNSSYERILNLHFIEGYDYEEICDILEISYSNCRTLISRAKESLRKKLKVES